MSKRKKILIFTAALSIPFIVTFLSMPGASKVITFKFRYNNLIYKTDHHALLAACRKLMNEGYYNNPEYDKKIDALIQKGKKER